MLNVILLLRIKKIQNLNLLALIVVYVLDGGLSNPEYFQNGFENIDIGGGIDPKSDEHGLIAASIIAHKTFGLAPEVQLKSIRVKSNKVQFSLICKALKEIKDHIRSGKEKNKVVINFSLNYSNPGKPGCEEPEFRELRALGVIIVASVGNKRQDACIYGVNQSEAIIRVGAIDASDQLWDNTNYGRCVDVVAPGRKILTYDSNGNLKAFSGSSFAAPHVSGIAAVYLSMGYTPEQTIQAIKTKTSATVWKDNVPHKVAYLPVNELMQQTNALSKLS